MEIKAQLFYGERVGLINNDVTVVVSNGVLTATYHSRKLLGGGLRACVDSQKEYDENAMFDGILQFKMDCAAAVDAVTYEVLAGSYYSNNERNYKVNHPFACPNDLASYVTRNKLTLYPFCVVQTSDGKEYTYEEWVHTIPY